MSLSNGTAGRRRVHAIPKTIVFEVEVERDGKAVWVEYTGYHRDRCPVWVELEVEAARDVYLDEAFVDVERTDPETDETVTERVFQHNREVEARYRRDVLLAVVKGLQEHEADVLMQGGEWLDMLTDLGWFQSADSSGEATADPEGEAVAAEAPTTAASSPASSPSTASPSVTS